ncbi:MAG: hypothetical protein WB679_18165, partial [Terracidiphilus sp.]
VVPAPAASRTKVAIVFDKNLLQQGSGESQSTLTEPNRDGIHRTVDIQLNRNDESLAIVHMLE